MRRILAAVLIICFTTVVFICCDKDPKQENAVTAINSPSISDQPNEPAGSLFDPVTDCDNRFVSVETNLLELEDMVIWQSFASPYILYYDKATGDSGALCAKPECMHMEKQNNADCLAYMGPGSKPASFCCYRGQIYWVGGYKQSGSYEQNALYRMNPDSSGKKLLFSFNPPDGHAPQEYRIHRGRLYLRCVTNRVTDGVPGSSLAIISTPIETKDFRVDYETEVPDTNPWSNIMRFIGDNVYFAYIYNAGEENGYVTKVIRHDINTGENEEIISDGALEGALTGFWIEPDGTMILAPYHKNTYRDMKIYRSVNGGPLEAFAPLCDENGEFTTRFFSGGIMWGIKSSEDGKSREIWIRDLEGNTLYKGALPKDFLKGTAHEDETLLFAGMACGTDSILMIYQFMRKDEERSAGDVLPSVIQFLVQYRLTENGLEEQLLIAGT